MISMHFYGFPKIFWDFYGFSLVFIDFRRLRGQKVWQPVAACGGLWRPVAPCGAGAGSPLKPLHLGRQESRQAGRLGRQGRQAGQAGRHGRQEGQQAGRQAG